MFQLKSFKFLHFNFDFRILFHFKKFYFWAINVYSLIYGVLICNCGYLLLNSKLFNIFYLLLNLFLQSPQKNPANGLGTPKKSSNTYKKSYDLQMKIGTESEVNVWLNIINNSWRSLDLWEKLCWHVKLQFLP